MDLIAALCFVSILLAYAMAKQEKLSRYVPLEGINMTVGVISKSMKDVAAACARECVDSDTCQSFFFNAVTGECQYHDTVFISPVGATDQEGIQYYFIIREGDHWCPIWKGFRLLTEDGPCVKHHTDLKTWFQANRTCVSYSPYSRLVILDTQVKNELVKTGVMAISGQLSYGVWIGLLRDTQDGYRWVNGEDADFFDWSHLDVNDDDTFNCVILHEGSDWKWAKRHCAYEKHYICEVHMEMSMYHRMMNRN